MSAVKKLEPGLLDDDIFYFANPRSQDEAMGTVKKLEPGLLDDEVLDIADPRNLEQFLPISISRMKQ